MNTPSLPKKPLDLAAKEDDDAKASGGSSSGADGGSSATGGAGGAGVGTGGGGGGGGFPPDCSTSRSFYEALTDRLGYRICWMGAEVLYGEGWGAELWREEQEKRYAEGYRNGYPPGHPMADFCEQEPSWEEMEQAELSVYNEHDGYDEYDLPSRVEDEAGVDDTSGAVIPPNAETPEPRVLLAEINDFFDALELAATTLLDHPVVRLRG